jgi:hypothetical protein
LFERAPVTGRLWPRVALRRVSGVAIDRAAGQVLAVSESPGATAMLRQP